MNSVLNAITPDTSSTDSLQKLSDNNSSLKNIIDTQPSLNSLYTGPSKTVQPSIGSGISPTAITSSFDSQSLLTSAQTSLTNTSTPTLMTQQSTVNMENLMGQVKPKRRPLSEIVDRLELLKNSSGIVEPVKLVSQLSTEDLLALLDYQASGELTDPRIESELYSVLLGINENYIDRNLLDISLKNDEAIKVLYNLRHEQLVYKLNLVKQQLTLKSILEQQLRTQQMTKLKLNELLKNYEQKLLILVNNYKKKLRQLQLVSTQLTPRITSNENISVSSLGRKFLTVRLQLFD